MNKIELQNEVTDINDIFLADDINHSWHSFTLMKEYIDDNPIMITNSSGCWLYDSKGRRYLDGFASMWTNIHGHNDPELKEALASQLNSLPYSSYVTLTHPKAAELSGKMIEIAPKGLSRIFFVNNGSNANETALKISFQYWQHMGKPEKREVICLKEGYHGSTFGAMSAGNSEIFHKRFKHWCFKSISIPAPECLEYGGKVHFSNDNESIKALEELLVKRSSEIACLILEPSIQPAAGTGMRMQPPGFLKKIVNLCREFNVHTIFDEIFVGFGRAGHLFACNMDNVVPDFLCLGKGISGGYFPFAATMTTEEIYQSFYADYKEGKAFFHGHTYSAHPMGCAVVLKSIEKLQRLIASGKFESTVNMFGKITTEFFKNHPYVRQIRQRGFIFALDLYPGKEGKDFPLSDRIAHNVSMLARTKEVIIRAFFNGISFVPPFIINEEEVRFLCQRTSESIIEYISKHSKKS